MDAMPRLGCGGIGGMTIGRVDARHLVYGGEDTTVVILDVVGSKSLSKSLHLGNLQKIKMVLSNLQLIVHLLFIAETYFIEIVLHYTLQNKLQNMTRAVQYFLDIYKQY